MRSMSHGQSPPSSNWDPQAFAKAQACWCATWKRAGCSSYRAMLGENMNLAEPYWVCRLVSSRVNLTFWGYTPIPNTPIFAYQPCNWMLFSRIAAPIVFTHYQLLLVTGSMPITITIAMLVMCFRWTPQLLESTCADMNISDQKICVICF